eukprot:5615444-Pleurochrysis_carterae.AAC.1
MALPSTAVRDDAGVLLTLALKHPRAFAAVLADARAITAPFDLDALGVKDDFLKNYLDLLAFLLQASQGVAKPAMGRWRDHGDSRRPIS